MGDPIVVALDILMAEDASGEELIVANKTIRNEVYELRSQVLAFGPSRDLLYAVATELRRAREKHPRPFNSSHEGYAILAEEVDELWDEVKAQTSERRYNAIRKEAIQIAAMCLRLVEDVCDRRSAGAEP